jgi:hypothetical protein
VKFHLRENQSSSNMYALFDEKIYLLKDNLRQFS